MWKLLIDFRKFNLWNLIDNGNAKRPAATAAQNMSISFYVFIKELGEIVKTHTITIFSWRWSTKVYFYGNTWKPFQFFCLVKFLEQQKWWKHFPTNIVHNVSNYIGIVRSFRAFPMIYCYHDHGLSPNMFW